QPGHYVKQVLSCPRAQQNKVYIFTWTQLRQTAGDQFQVCLCIEQRFQSNKPQRIALYYSDANRSLRCACFHQYSFQDRGVMLCIVSKKWSARSESIMNLSPSPFLSRVHVLMLKRKVPSSSLGLLAGFQPVSVWTENKTICMAKSKAAPVAFTITLLCGRV